MAGGCVVHSSWGWPLGHRSRICLDNEWVLSLCTSSAGLWLSPGGSNAVWVWRCSSLWSPMVAGEVQGWCQYLGHCCWFRNSDQSFSCALVLGTVSLFFFF